MSSTIRTTFDVILLNVQARLMAVLGWPAERVLLDAENEVQPGSAADDAEYHPQADQYVRIRWKEESTGAEWDGMGRVAMVDTVKLAVQLWTRLTLDDVNQSSTWLTDATLGHARARHAVINALAGWQPTDANGNWLVQKPMEVKNGQTPSRKRGGDGWGASTVSADVVYILDLDQTYQ